VSQGLRQAVAQEVLADPETYSCAFLGRPTQEYAAWIQDSSSWGGQIELSILSKLLRTEIVALDIIRNRQDTYGTDLDTPRRIFVIYDGIHYDAVAYCFDPQLPRDMDTTIFSPNDIVVLERAKDLCAQEHQRRAFTDTSRFTLRCLVCQKGLHGQAEAGQHARQTGHANFAEYL
jgi:ubiquitin thioesterase OTU1